MFPFNEMQTIQLSNTEKYFYLIRFDQKPLNSQKMNLILSNNNKKKESV